MTDDMLEQVDKLARLLQKGERHTAGTYLTLDRDLANAVSQILIGYVNMDDLGRYVIDVAAEANA